MNPFIFDPKKVQTPDQAHSIERMYDRQIAIDVANVSTANDMVGATLDVLNQVHPDQSEQFDSLTNAARLAGQTEQARNSSMLMKQQFHAALPYAVRKAMEAENL